MASGAPYLPKDVWLNVNFPAVSDSECNTAEDFAFILTRLHVAVPLVTPDDVTTCGGSRLPTELEVSMKSGCYASVSVGNAGNKSDANATAQATVLSKLGDIITCLP